MLMKKTAIICAPNSGAAYTSSYLRNNGYDLPHELSMGHHGIVSWLWAAHQGFFPPWGEPKIPHLELIVCKTIKYIHLIRNTRDCIISHLYENKQKGSFKYRSYVINKEFDIDLKAIENEYERAAIAYYYWNIQCEAHTDQRIQVENLNGIENYIIGNTIDLPKKPINKNSKPRLPFHWDQISSNTKALISEMAAKYGYEDPF